MSPGRVIFRLRSRAEDDEDVVAEAFDEEDSSEPMMPSCCAFWNASRSSE